MIGTGRRAISRKIASDGFGLSALLGVDARISAGSVNQGENRPAKLRGQLHDAQRLAITLRLGLAEISLEPLFCVAAFLVADDGYGPSVKLRETRNQGFVVAIAAVAVQLDKVGEKHADVIERVRTLRVPRNLGALPGPEVAVKFPAQLGHLLTNSFELCVGFFVAGELAQFLNVFFEALDLALALRLRAQAFYFVLGLHHITKSIDCSPNDSRIAAMSSGQDLTRCST